MTTAPFHSVSTIPSNPSAAAWGARVPRRKMIGTSAMPSNSNIDSAALPTGVRVPEIGRTTAVEDMARARPSARAPVQYCPRMERKIAISDPPTSNSSDPRPKTSRRNCHRRLYESSSPIANSSSTMPSSANGSSRSGSVIVNQVSHSYSDVARPRPNGPTTTPTRMKPMMGVILNRANSGITIPTAPKITSASDIIGGIAVSAFIRREYFLRVERNALARLCWHHIEMAPAGSGDVRNGLSYAQATCQPRNGARVNRRRWWTDPAVRGADAVCPGACHPRPIQCGKGRNAGRPDCGPSLRRAPIADRQG